MNSAVLTVVSTDYTAVLTNVSEPKKCDDILV